MLSERLKEERTRLNKTQDQIATLTGVAVQTQRRYEAGKRLPDAKYLELIANEGFDVQYLITGFRSVNKEIIYQQPTDALSNILEMQEEFGTFNAEQIKALIGYAWHNQAGIDDLRDFIKAALVVAGASED